MEITRHQSFSQPRVSRVSARAIVALLDEARHAGGHVDALLRSAGITATYADMKAGKVASVARSNLTLLVRECIRLLEAHACEGSGHPPMVEDEFELLCHCLISAKTLEEAIQRASRFCAMLNGKAGELTLSYEGSSARFSMNTIRGRQDGSVLISDLLGLSSYYRLFSWLVGESLSIAALELRSSELIANDLILELFHYPVRYGQSANAFVFPSVCLSKPVVRSPDELTQLLQLFPFDLVSADLTLASLYDTVYAIIKSRLLRQQAIPTTVQLAALFNISDATFRRRLDEEGASASRIKETCRMDLARELLGEARLSLDEIADRLGFSSANTFRRAFSNWTGQTPAAYRDAIQGGNVSPL